MKFGEKLRKLRLEKHLTQEEVAKTAEISRRAYISYEQDNVRPRNKETYSKLAKVLGCNEEYLVQDDKAAVAAVAGMLSAVTTISAVNGLAGLATGGMVAGLTLFADKLKGVSKEVEREPVNNSKNLLIQYENLQKRFKAIATGIIINTLAEKGIIYRQGRSDRDQLDSYPDEVLNIENSVIKSWWFDFWAKDFELDEKYLMSKKNRATILFSRYVTVPKNPTRKMTLVVDDRELFDYICQFENNNSYNANVSVFLVDTDSVTLVCERYLARDYSLGEKDVIDKLLEEMS
ncbi:transcriptional regulator with XRE-family HTH domain [Lachnospiraceae bacterium PF1-21]|uniref:helix-turn-helix transcriptional regulator n=1 Tax=Ohessyouella blattaphilus TaxID=2949333 RepID=UPI003E283484